MNKESYKSNDGSNSNDKSDKSNGGSNSNDKSGKSNGGSNSNDKADKSNDGSNSKDKKPAETINSNGSISGYKINDTNGNGKWDEGEKGIQGWTIVLKAGDFHINEETVTDASGFYKFDDLPRGEYKIEEKNQNGWQHTSSPVKHIKLADEDNSRNNNFTNMLIKPTGT